MHAKFGQLPDREPSQELGAWRDGRKVQHDRCAASLGVHQAMQTIGLSAIVGLIIGGLIIFLVGFENPASKVLTVIVCTSLAGAIGGLIRRKKS